MTTKPPREDYHVTPEAEAVEAQYRPRIAKVPVHSWKSKKSREGDLRGNMALSLPVLRCLASQTLTYTVLLFSGTQFLGLSGDLTPSLNCCNDSPRKSINTVHLSTGIKCKSQHRWLYFPHELVLRI
jgi:hypothetical protein